MLCLPDGRDAFVMTRPIHEWNVQDVYEWIGHIAGGKFKIAAKLFRDKDIDGDKLVKLTRIEMQNELNITDPVHRRQIMYAYLYVSILI